MLPKIARLKSSSSRRGRWSLILGSLALFALPTWFAAAQSQDVKPKPVDAAGVKSASPATVTADAAAAAATAQTESLQVEFFPELSQKEKHIVEQLDLPTTFDFTDESLDGVRETVMERHGFDILIERDELEEESIASDAADLTLKVNEVPLRSALKLLLGRKNLAYVIEDDVLKITTQSAYANDRLTRIYPVRDLTDNKPDDFQSLMEAIRQGVTPGFWKDTSSFPAPAAAYTAPGTFGGGVTGAQRKETTSTISMVPASGSLVIHQSWQGHDEVLKLLRALRKAKNLSPRK